MVIRKKENTGGGCIFTLFILIRGFRFEPVTSILTVFSNNPLFIVIVTAAFFLPWNWQFLAAGVLAFFFSLLAGSTSAPFHYIMIHKEMQELKIKFNHCSFIPVPVEDFINVLGDQPAEAASPGKKRPRLRDTSLSDTEYFLGNHMRFIVVENEPGTDGPALPSIVAYYTMAGSWVFLKSRPEDMTDLEKFVALHEIGHTDSIGNIKALYHGNYIPILVSAPLIIALLSWNLTALAVAATIVAVILLEHLHTKGLRKYFRFFEEVYADTFAFSKSKKEWFGDLSGEALANFFCDTVDVTGKEALVNPDPPMTENQIKARKEAFVKNLEQLRSGGAFSTDSIDHLIPFKRINYIDLLFAFSTICLLIGLGTQAAPVTLTGFLLFAGLVILLGLCCLVMTLLPQHMATTMDYEFDYSRREELTEEQRKQIDKGYEWASFFRQTKEKYRPKKTEGEYRLAAGTSETLFLPAEINLYVVFKPLTAYVFHTKTISYDIARIKYFSEDHSLVVVYNDGSEIDLGVKLGEEVRPHFLKATVVTFNRTENGEAMESLVVPFEKA